MTCAPRGLVLCANADGEAEVKGGIHVASAWLSAWLGVATIY